MRYLVVSLLLLAGCATRSAEQDQAAFDQAFDDCAGAFKPSTQAHYSCVEKTLGLGQPARIRPSTTDCHPDGYGGVRCKTR